MQDKDFSLKYVTRQGFFP